MKIPKRKLKRIIELGALKEGVLVYDLGAGMGRIMLEAAKTGAHVVGYEIDRAKCFWVQAQIKHKMQYNAEIVQGNLLNADLSEPDIVYAYLSPPLMKSIGEKAIKEMKPGARIISVEHKIPDWTPTFQDEKEKIYVYQKT